MQVASPKNKKKHRIFLGVSAGGGGGILGPTPTLTPLTDLDLGIQVSRALRERAWGERGDGCRVITRKVPPWNSAQAPTANASTSPKTRFSSLVTAVALSNKAGQDRERTQHDCGVTRTQFITCCRPDGSYELFTDNFPIIILVPGLGGRTQSSASSGHNKRVSRFSQWPLETLFFLFFLKKSLHFYSTGSGLNTVL